MYDIAVVTGTRAEYGLLRPVLAALEAEEQARVSLLVTGSHLCEALGATVREIEADGRPVAARLDVLEGDPAPDTAAATARAIALFGGWFAANRCDLVVLLGDRYEIFGAAVAAAVRHIPIAHIAGGEHTEGANDEFFRHCITEMASLHFTSTEAARRCVIQLGQRPETVFFAGSLGAENIKNLPPWDAAELSKSIGFDCTKPFVLATYHPATASADSLAGLRGLLAALDALKLRVLFTKANADEGGAAVNARLESWCAGRRGAALVPSLGVSRYLGAMRLCSCVAGNSSSAVVEAPTLGKPAVDIGERQKGRDTGAGVLHCGSAPQEIEAALKKALSPDFQAFAATAESPYGKSDASAVIARECLSALRRGIGRKSFYEVDFEVKA